MNSKITSDQTFGKKKNSRLKNRRAVTEIISTMMLMGVTVTGASTLTYFMNDAFLEGNLGTVSTLDSSSLNLLLLAYDTRDSDSLLTLLGVDNLTNSYLCRSSCSANPDTSPALGGTEFIVMQIQNNGIDPIFLHGVSIGNEMYSWDSSTAGVELNVGLGQHPSDGMFSIMPIGSSPPTQNDSIQIQNGQAVNILIKLDSINPDIQLTKSMQISLNTGSIKLVKFLIESGDAR